jgi:N-acetylmuramoyl-L-alanine amidase
MKIFAAVVVGTALLAASPSSALKICVDPGHGGDDPGGVGCGLEEEDIVLDTSQRLQTLLEDAGFDVVITRNSDVFITLDGRTDFANAQGADRFASIHANAFGDASANGTETFCATNASAASFDMRDRIQAELLTALGLRDRGGKTADFHVLRFTNMPATLSELGFVTNCSVDADVLNDPNMRQAAAEAHLIAIAEHLNVDIDDPAPPANGELLGVVFEDQGVGTDNMDIRLVGASVVVVGTNESATAEGDGASWTFSLPPGDHTVRASAPGYITNERTCTVTAGAQAWCSIGLFPEEQVGEGEGEQVGEGEGEQVGEGEGEGEDVEIQTRPKRVTILPAPKSCAQMPGMPLVALFALLGLFRRTRGGGKSSRVLRRAAALLLVVSGPASAFEIVNEKVVAKGQFTSTALSPDGARVLVSDDHYAGLSVVDVKSGAISQLTLAERAGFRPMWVDDARVAYRLSKTPFNGEPLVMIDLRGKFVGPHVENVRVKQDGDAVIMNGQRISPMDDTCFAPLVSARGDVAYQCLVSGVHLFRGGVDHALGAGASLSFAHSGDMLAYARSRDEGHVIVESDIVVVDLRNKAPVVHVLSSPRVERAPSLSADGRTIAFVVEDQVVVAELHH